ncbi:tetratricopeptide repeat protein [Roseovarius sp. C7]|uniref:tetratricopeptide repeat protein n=1 Tax=Roseovarius sp. C7 TaxID=3398643 RepID=UPI0039F6D266
MRYLSILSCVVLMALPVAGMTQARDETLADIRQELTVLHVEIQKLKRELSTTGGAATSSGGDTVIARVNAIESELQKLTAKTEELELRINRVVSDGTNRIGDLEFRLVELEGGDVSQLGETSTLGGEAVEGSVGGGAALGGGSTGAGEATTELAIGEQSDFDRAKAEMEAGNTAKAAELFAAFQTAYPGGPLTGEAGVLRGEALEAEGDLTGAARAYLDTFSADRAGPVASKALFRLGRTLGRLGQSNEACVALQEVETRYPASSEVAEAKNAMVELGCS